MRHWFGAMCLVWAIACKSDERQQNTAFMPTSVTATGGISDTDSTSVASLTGEQTSGDKLDFGSDTDPSGTVMGCEKIDLLFVVDNSASMYDEQQNLLQNFPTIFTGVEQLLSGDDVQIMVIDTDIGVGHTCYEAMYNSFDCGLWCDANCPSGCNCECNAEECSPWSEIPCDAELGAGRVADGNESACGLPAGRRYLAPQDAQAQQTFSCLADVGITGEPNERPMQALLQAIGPLSEPGGCNDGFLRSDALLIVVLLTDEDDSLASPGDPPQWYEAVVQAKLGNPNAVVVLSLLGDPDLPGGLCPPFDPNDNSGAEPAPRLRAFTEMFEFGSIASVCEPSYAEVFEASLTAIDEACEEFIPPG